MIYLRESIEKAKSRRSTALALALVCSLIVLAHSAIGMNHDGEPMGDSSADMLSMCMAIVDLGLAFALLCSAGPWAAGSRRISRLRQLSFAPTGGGAPTLAPTPATLQVFRL